MDDVYIGSIVWRGSTNVIMVDCFMEDSGGLKGSKKGLVLAGFAKTLAM